MTSPYRRIVVPALATLIMLTVLLGLGTWQVYRLHWKQGMLARIASAEAAPAVPLTPDPGAYAKVFTNGRFRFDLSAQYGVEVRDTKSGPTMGFHQIVPLERANAATVLVDRGWIPQKRATALDNPDGEVAVTGYVRPGEKSSWFSAPDDIAARQFYTLDPRIIASAVGAADPAPFTLVVLGSSTGETFPVPAQHLPRPTNNHLSYVVTWYGLAVALVVIFAARVRKAPR